MSQKVRIVHPKHKPFKSWLRSHFPDAYEHGVTIAAKFKDRRYEHPGTNQFWLLNSSGLESRRDFLRYLSSVYFGTFLDVMAAKKVNT